MSTHSQNDELRARLLALADDIAKAGISGFGNRIRLIVDECLTPAAVAGEAVAWRYRYFNLETGVGFWRYSEGEPKPSCETGSLGFEKHPLYTAPVVAGEAVLQTWMDRYNDLIRADRTYEAEQVLRCINDVKYDRALATAGGSAVGWQPMESAPRDGTRILVHFARDRVGVREVAWTAPEYADDYQTWCVDDLKFGPYPLRKWCDGDATGWQPLPTPPAAQGAK